MKKHELGEGPFDRQYVDAAGTTAAEAAEEQQDLPAIETEHYGVAKPRRVVVRGKIIHEE